VKVTLDLDEALATEWRALAAEGSELVEVLCEAMARYLAEREGRAHRRAVWEAIRDDCGQARTGQSKSRMRLRFVTLSAETEAELGRWWERGRQCRRKQLLDGHL
jgi:hypothetical protein